MTETLVIALLRNKPGKWAHVLHEDSVAPNIPSHHLMDLACDVNLGNGEWSPAGAFSAVIRDASDLYVRFNSDEPDVTEVVVAYRASLKYGNCFDCGLPGAPYLLIDVGVMNCPLCAAEAAVAGAQVTRLER
jgi:hypothetical protein